MCPQRQALQWHLEPPGAGRGRKDPPLEPPEGAWPYHTSTSDFRAPGLGESTALQLKQPSAWSVVTATLGH